MIKFLQEIVVGCIIYVIIPMLPLLVVMFMMNDDILETWYTCPQCGHEGFLEDMEHGEDDVDCQEYLKDIGLIA